MKKKAGYDFLGELEVAEFGELEETGFFSIFQGGFFMEDFYKVFFSEESKYEPNDIEKENTRLKSAIDYVLSYLCSYAYYDSREVMIQKIISFLKCKDDSLNDSEKLKLSTNCQ